MSKHKNLAVAGGLVLLITGGMSFPYYYMTSSRNLYKQNDALTGSQQIRGAYLNTGSKDAGRDPGRCAHSVLLPRVSDERLTALIDWDTQTNTYKGRSSLHQETNN